MFNACISFYTLKDWILPISCNPIARSTVFQIGDKIEMTRHTIEAKQLVEVQEDFEGLFPSPEEVQEAEWDADDDIEPFETESTKADADDFTPPESMDESISASVLLPHGDDAVRAKAVGRKHGRDGNPHGMRHSNPILDTREYQIGISRWIDRNICQVDEEEGRQFVILQEITDHKKDGSAMSKDDGFTENRHGQCRPKLTMRGWKLLDT
jgi:hypothetical protein